MFYLYISILTIIPIPLVDHYIFSPFQISPSTAPQFFACQITVDNGLACKNEMTSLEIT